jgi:regulator of sirC expression with transglutaminase-like and TPR domain
MRLPLSSIRSVILRCVNGPDSQALVDLLARRSTAIDLDRAALEIARMEYPDLDSGPCLRQIDEYAWAIADRTRDMADGERFVAMANAWLFGEQGFQGNQDDYYNPENSYLNRVLETRLGIPITLSLIYIEVARRLAKPVFGIALPNHFLIRYDDGQYATYIDPFHGGTLLDAERCRELAQVESLEAEDFAPVSKRTTVMRMLNNLRQIYFGRQDAERVLRIVDLLIAANPSGADEYKQRAVALALLKRMNAAMAAFQRYLELSPNAEDKAQIEEHMSRIAFWLAARN